MTNPSESVESLLEIAERTWHEVLDEEVPKHLAKLMRRSRVMQSLFLRAFVAGAKHGAELATREHERERAQR